MTLSDVDGVATAGLSPIAVAHYLGIAPTYIDATSVGGCSFLVHVRHAGRRDQRRTVRGGAHHPRESGRSRVGMPPRVADPASPQGQFEAPYGTFGPPTMFPMGVLRFMKEFGLTHEQLASVAVAQRKWAPTCRARCFASRCRSTTCWRRE